MRETIIDINPGEHHKIIIRCSGVPGTVNPEETLAIVESEQNGGDIVETPEMARNMRKTRKNRKNNGATRKNRKQSGGNAYMNFAKTERSKVLNDHPEMKSDVVAVAKEIGKRWRAMKNSA
jgi:hypothetical protein